MSPTKCPRACAFVIADTITMYPEQTYRNGMAVITASVIRNHPNAVPPRVKSLNYLNNILGKIEANDAGVEDAIMLNHLGNVAECTAGWLMSAQSTSVPLLRAPFWSSS